MWNSDKDLFTQAAATDRHSLPLDENDAKLGLQCEECVDRDANCWCENCNVNLCSQCFHKNSKTLRRHKPFTIEMNTLQAKNNLQDKVDLGKETLPRINTLQLKLNSEIKKSSDDLKEEIRSNEAKSTTTEIKELRETTTMNSAKGSNVQELPLNQAKNFCSKIQLVLILTPTVLPVSYLQIPKQTKAILLSRASIKIPLNKSPQDKK